VLPVTTHLARRAKEVASLDYLCDGRFDFGVGVGWLAEEFAALHVPFEERGARCRDYLKLMQRCWTDPVSKHESRFYSLPECRLYPKPVQQPHPPIHFGGESDAALKRVADLGQGWFGFSIGPEETGQRLVLLDRLLATRGRSRQEIQISISPYMNSTDFDLVQRYHEAGVDQVIVLVVAFDRDSLLAALDGFATSLVEPARRL